MQFLTGVNSAGGLFVSVGFDAVVSFFVVSPVSIFESGSFPPPKSNPRMMLKIFIIFGFLSNLNIGIDRKREILGKEARTLDRWDFVEPFAID